MTEWMIEGPEIATCNCFYECPCQFNSLPTNGDCRTTVALHIDKGHYDKVELETQGKHTHLAKIHLTGQGLVL